MIGRIAAVGIALLIANTSVAANAAPDEADRAASAMVANFMSAWSGADANKLAGLFAPDADFINPWGTQASGRSQIRAFYAEAFKAGFAGSQGNGNVISVRPLSPELLIIDATWTIVGAKMPDGTPRVDEKGILTAIIGNGPGGWQILALRENASADAIKPL